MAALWVVTYHFFRGSALNPLYSTAFLHGYLAVDVFFILSGFVMALSYAALFSGGFTARNYGIFLIRRIARIYPLYVLATLLAAAAMLSGHGDQDIRAMLRPLDYVANFFLVQVWDIGPSIDTVSWSISAEFAAYLLFPLLAAIVLFSRPVVAVCGTILAFILLCVLVYVAAPALHVATDGLLEISDPACALPVFRSVAEFTIGLAAYRTAAYSSCKRWLGHPASLAIILLAMLGLLDIPDADLLVVALIPLLIIGLATGGNRLSRLFGARVPFFLGEISYALYLLHFQFYRLWHAGQARLLPHVGREPANLIAAAVTYASLIACSYGVYRWIERPARKRIRGFESWLGGKAEQDVESSEQLGVDRLTSVENKGDQLPAA